VFSYISPEARVPPAHPLRPIRQFVDQMLVELSPEFDRLYSRVGRPLDDNLLFRWFVGLSMDDRVRDPTSFTKNRRRLLDGEIAQRFFARVLEQARQRDRKMGAPWEITDEIELLMTLPGVDFILATVICTEIGDVARFFRSEQLAAYAGTTPRVHESGGRRHYGPSRTPASRASTASCGDECLSEHCL
jgi:hypothetical protein